MAILTRDGKVYVLEGPNPIVESQASWDKSKLVFHNFQWDVIFQKAIADRKPKIPKPDQKPEPTPPPPVAEEAHQEAERDEGGREFDLPFIKYKVLCHCLPAKVEQRSDSLYGETWMRVNYGSKFVFPCVLMSATDLLIEFWTSDPKHQISEKSVVYPFTYEVYNQQTESYDRVPYDDYRWWRVNSKDPKEGGWLFTAVPSDFQPDFSG